MPYLGFANSSGHASKLQSAATSSLSQSGGLILRPRLNEASVHGKTTYISGFNFSPEHARHVSHLRRRAAGSNPPVLRPLSPIDCTWPRIGPRDPHLKSASWRSTSSRLPSLKSPLLFCESGGCSSSATSASHGAPWTPACIGLAAPGALGAQHTHMRTRTYSGCQIWMKTAAGGERTSVWGLSRRS